GVHAGNLSVDGGRVARLVEQHFDAAREDDRDTDPEPEVLRLAADVDPAAAQVCGGRADLVAHEGEFVLRRLLGRMHADLRGRKREDQPAVPGVDVTPAEDV